MRSRILLTTLAVMMMAVAVFAGEFDSVINVSEGEADYTAPKPVTMVKPERVFYNNHREVEGFVTLAMLVNEEGKVEEVKVLFETSKLAINNALDAANDWKFEPAQLNGDKVKAWVSYNLPFGQKLDTFKDEQFAQKVVVDGQTLALK